jgi:hypothetical protein
VAASKLREKKTQSDVHDHHHLFYQKHHRIFPVILAALWIRIRPDPDILEALKSGSGL